MAVDGAQLQFRGVMDPDNRRPVDYERFTGSRVKLTTYQPVNGNRHFEGRLESFRDRRLTLDLSAARCRLRIIKG